MRLRHFADQAVRAQQPELPGHFGRATTRFRDADGHLFELFHDWVPDAATRRRILVDNPARLYDFPSAATEP